MGKASEAPPPPRALYPSSQRPDAAPSFSESARCASRLSFQADLASPRPFLPPDSSVSQSYKWQHLGEVRGGLETRGKGPSPSTTGRKGAPLAGPPLPGCRSPRRDGGSAAHMTHSPLAPTRQSLTSPGNGPVVRWGGRRRPAAGSTWGNPEQSGALWSWSGRASCFPSPEACTPPSGHREHTLEPG